LVAAWFGFNRRPAPTLEANRDQQVDQQSTTPPAAVKPEPLQTAAVPSPKPAEIQKHREAPHTLLAVNKRRPNRTLTRPPVLTPQELAQKEQVLVALRLVSFKLNLAQRKTQGPPPLNTIG
jgi:hypothetical protein